MSYYMTPSNVSLKTWNPLLIRSHSGVTDVPRQAPALPVTIGSQTIYSLQDVRPSITESQRVERSVSIVNDVAVVNYTIADRDLEVRKEELRLTVNALRNEKLDLGYAHDFGPPYGVKTLDTRTSEDRDNWLGATAIYKPLIDADQGAVVGATIRTADNVNIQLSFQDAYDIIIAGLMHRAALLNRSWQLKDAIKDAPDHAALDAIDIAAGWPG